ncbi:hypothetical protein RIR_jg25810.t1 [Rhizophagus irregularis DAOM 181602=DAOM 197198]|nr:hypothetical protein RIR_jg25810.t1 [Rhizophagus irregularis DAOM 181602=DAOM 197198]
MIRCHMRVPIKIFPCNVPYFRTRHYTSKKFQGILLAENINFWCVLLRTLGRNNSSSGHPIHTILTSLECSHRALSNKLRTARIQSLEGEILHSKYKLEL